MKMIAPVLRRHLLGRGWGKWWAFVEEMRDRDFRRGWWMIEREEAAMLMDEKFQKLRKVRQRAQITSELVASGGGPAVRLIVIQIFIRTRLSSRV
jgi:hypothetical protein